MERTAENRMGRDSYKNTLGIPRCKCMFFFRDIRWRSSVPGVWFVSSGLVDSGSVSVFRGRSPSVSTLCVSTLSGTGLVVIGLQVIRLLQVGLLQVVRGVQRVGLLRVARSPAGSVPSVSTFCLSTFSGTGFEVSGLQQVGLLRVDRVVLVVVVLVIIGRGLSRGRVTVAPDRIRCEPRSSGCSAVKKKKVRVALTKAIWLALRKAVCGL
jgi:hypothetical protein